MRDALCTDQELVARTSISLAPLMMDVGDKRKKLGGFKSFSAYIEALIRADAQKGIVAPKTKAWLAAA